ncbi:hypothetical protein D8771_16060 [Streptomyces albus]|uniref:Uncharacterized protein n=2 Tax=Streptomyces TaxID=1883 RepID=A0A8H1QR56_9ACTN|nr:hypothetical protein D8771_16060 [Streptomyces albus]
MLAHGRYMTHGGETMAGTARQRGAGTGDGGAARDDGEERGTTGVPGGAAAAPGEVSAGEALLRAELAPRELWSRAALVVGVCAGCGFLASGLYDYTHPGRPKGPAAALSLGVGVVLMVAALLTLLTLHGRSRDRRRLIALAEPACGEPAALRGLRSGWLALSGLGLALAFLFLVAGLGQALSPGPYEEPDPTVYGALLAWAAILTAAGCGGIARARRHRPTGTGGTRQSARPGSRVRPAPPASPRAALYARLGGRPVAPHRLSSRLDARLMALSRPAALALAVAATAFCCALAAATVLVPRHVGGGRPLFWILLVATACCLAALLLELADYGPRRRYVLLSLVAGLALLPVAGTGYSTSVLLERGIWVETEVTAEHHHARGGPSCDLRPLAPTVPAEGLSVSCDGAETGDRVRVHADPEGEVGPRRTAPHDMSAFTVGWGAATAVLLGCAVGAALHGHRRRTELGLATTEGNHG